MKITSTLYFLTFILTINCTLLNSQIIEEDYNFISVKNNISQRAVSTITQDQQGLIWMGTNGVGLNKYDGVSFKSYRQDSNSENSLSSSLIRSSYNDSSNRLWVGTEMGLNLYNRDFDNFEKVKLYSNSEEIHKVSIRAIVELDSGELLIGSHFYGIFKVNPETLIGTSINIKTKKSISGLQINSLVKNKNGKIFIGSNYGLFEYNDIQIVPVLTNYDESSDATQILYHIESMLVDNEGSLWLGTFSDGLIKIGLTPFNSYFVKNYKITGQRVLSLIQAPNGRLLCGTENDGLFVVTKEGEIIKNYHYSKFGDSKIDSNSIWSLFVDNEERIWIGYYNKGVGKYDKFYNKFKSIKSLPNVQNSLQSPSVTAIVGDEKEQIWIGIDGGGIDVYNPNTQKITHLLNSNNGIAEGLTNKDIVALHIDVNKNLWVGTWNAGIFYLPNGSKKFINYTKENTVGLESNRIMSFAESSKGIIWIGTFLKGLHCYNTKTKVFKHNDILFQKFNISQNDIHKVLVDSNDNIWVGTTLGLYKVIPDSNGRFDAVSLEDKMYTKHEKKYIVHDIVTLFEDKNKNIWIGTDGAGVCKYSNSTKEFVWINNSKGLENETVATIIEADNGDIWIGGNKGITKYDIKNETFTNFDTNDGLLANDFNFNCTYKSPKGILYFGNYRGINYLDPSNISINKHIPDLYFSDFKLFNKSIEPNSKKSPLKKVISETKHLTLTHKQSVFTIEYAGINYTKPEKNQYAYYLEGFDDRWNFVGNNRSATYTNLSAGEYKFKVKASNNDGIWNEEPLQLLITITPPWWNSKLAWFCYILFTLLLTYIIIKIAKQRVNEKQLVQFELDKRLQEEVLNDRKIQFFTNISHEFRTPLTLISNPLEDIIDDETLLLPQSVKEKHAIIHKNTNRLKRLIDELMDFRKIQLNKLSIKVSKIEPISFVKEITSHFKEESSLKNIMLTFDSDEIPIDLWSDPGMLEKIIFNILSNAFKITPENGLITVSVIKSKNKLIFPLIDDTKEFSAIEISIEDTGIGINKEDVKNIFERFYQVKKLNSQYYGGTGIGLEVVKSFIDLLKGQILVESEESVGTKFRIFLPLGKEHFSETELFLAPTKTEEKTSPDDENIEIAFNDDDNTKKTLLITEDNVELRSYLTKELRNEYSILEAKNGLEGVQIANEKMPDIIITDVIMPEMDGFEFCEKIKQDIKTSHIPVLMLTAKAMTDDWVKGIDSGADVYLTKPFDMKVLKAQLKQIVVSRQLLLDKYFKDTRNVKIPENTSPIDKKFITKVLDYINNNLSDESLNVEQLADELFLSRSQLYRKIKALTGYTANEFLRKIRLEKAKEMIENGHESISEVGFKVGFSSPSYFTKCFKSHFGILPTEIKQE